MILVRFSNGFPPYWTSKLQASRWTVILYLWVPLFIYSNINIVIWLIATIVV